MFIVHISSNYNSAWHTVGTVEGTMLCCLSGMKGPRSADKREFSPIGPHWRLPTTKKIAQGYPCSCQGLIMQEYKSLDDMHDDMHQLGTHAKSHPTSENFYGVGWTLIENTSELTFSPCSILLPSTPFHRYWFWEYSLLNVFHLKVCFPRIPNWVDVRSGTEKIDA